VSVESGCFVVSPFARTGTLTLHGFAVRFLRLNALHEFLLGESRISIQVHPSDDCYHICGGSEEAVLLEEHLKVALVNIAIAPVVDGVVGLCIVEGLVRLHALLHLLCHPIEGDLFFKQPRQVGFSFCAKEVSS